MKIIRIKKSEWNGEKSENQFIFDEKQILDELFLLGNEGYRQIKNYFGDDFFLKSGKLNRKKLDKFVNSNKHKLKILYYLLDPIIENELSKKIEVADKDKFIDEVILIQD